ncbi:MAG: hypothetical protein KDB01_23570, partial [Planctomycetaceae bacterium]|nr:hypothetical protein [Planctomycetaceae bacterium]
RVHSRFQIFVLNRESTRMNANSCSGRAFDAVCYSIVERKPLTLRTQRLDGVAWFRVGWFVPDLFSEADRATAVIRMDATQPWQTKL